ncbi:MAG: hypothetical protein ABW123_26750 [Cystobacter sp.]
MTSSIPAHGIEVRGPVVRALLDSVDVVRPEVKRILAVHGITAQETRPWYALSQVLDCLQDVQSRVGQVTVRAIGQQVPRHTAYPPHITTFQMALYLMNTGYLTNHQGAGDIGGYHHEPMDGRSSRMRCNTPYPCDFNQGVLEGLHARFAGRGSLRLRIEHDAAGCRCRGDAACVYHLKW